MTERKADEVDKALGLAIADKAAPVTSQGLPEKPPAVGPADGGPHADELGELAKAGVAAQDA